MSVVFSSCWESCSIIDYVLCNTLQCNLLASQVLLVRCSFWKWPNKTLLILSSDYDRSGSTAVGSADSWLCCYSFICPVFLLRLFKDWRFAQNPVLFASLFWLELLMSQVHGDWLSSVYLNVACYWKGFVPFISADILFCFIFLLCLYVIKLYLSGICSSEVYS